MSHVQNGWIEVGTLAAASECETAVDQMRRGTPPATKCAEMMDKIIQEHGEKLDRYVQILKPGAELVKEGLIALLPPNPTFPRSDHILVMVALTRLDETRGMYSFFISPEDKSAPKSTWVEEKIVLRPGEGIMYRNDCEKKKTGNGEGGLALVMRYQ
nr:hypothetical protein CFP56_56562 [Quercus suber]